ncbi:MAG TPA: hypothetical protein VFI86_05980, partial [Burkholderiales bacterium]|nr:hypothetical protein [Burkholderiales bacterium]
MTHPALALILGGAVGAMAFGAVMVYVARRNDFVALSLGIFLACLSASLLLGGDGAPGQRAGVVALPFLAWFCAALRPGAWARRAALASGLLGATAAAAGWLALAQGLSVAVAAWAAAVSV